MNYNSLYLTLIGNEDTWARRESARTWSVSFGADRAWLQRTEQTGQWLLALSTDADYERVSEYTVFERLNWF